MRAAVPEAEILVADDHSPDGTGRIADELAAADDHIHVMHRLGKEGLGGGLHGRLRLGPRAPGSRSWSRWTPTARTSPSSCPRLLDALRDADLVLGSRWVPGGEVVNWPKSREFLSRGGNLYTRLALDVPLQDATGGYRAFRASTLRRLELDDVASQGYCFQVDMARRTVQSGHARAWRCRSRSSSGSTARPR